MKIEELYEKQGRGVRCLVCERGCLIEEGKKGICRNYANLDGRLIHIGYGKLSAIESRPIEIKPFFHYYPNSTALTFSGFGCNFYCPWCQNYHLSFSDIPEGIKGVSAEELVRLALRNNDKGLCASFNEPATLYTYLLDVFELGKKRNLYACLVTNGYFTLKALRNLIENGASGFSIDIKGCPKMKILSVDHKKVFRNAKEAINLGAHVEMVYLVVTNTNDSEECYNWIFDMHLKMLGEDVPLHINRYYPMNYWKEPPTPVEKLVKLKEIAQKEYNLNYVYVGNIGSIEHETTYCPKCGEKLIIRSGYRVLKWNLRDNRCPRCGEKIPVYGEFTRF
ncbi:Radical SAM, Pyruvate-formate lyase-activating enzyme like [Thermococcus sp. 2319x1]|uniref:radical SAM protein n=1 Tax=Thermococcus sp. 2319x1 TaxID=1674923 RepID=UPI00073ABBE5|nr:radical SAM protein [Thermococcus sp. 2319x1]ALV62480.1 Radical SAM, Pyruvate-formate lyase-activating enzyme like [Thermococcus sp. 2319x1]